MKWYYLGLGFVFFWFMGGGITHFTAVDFYLKITPPWVPYPLEVVYISGVLEILGAIGILIPRTRQLAGNCLILLTLAVTPANIYMSMNLDLFPGLTETRQNIRLGVQVLLLICIWWSTRNRRWSETGRPAF